MNFKNGVSTKIENTNLVGVIVERSIYWKTGNTIHSDAEDVETSKYKMYLPSDLDYSDVQPVVVALDPSGSYNTQLNTWRDVAESHKWIIMASKEFRNEIDATPIISDLATEITNLPATYPEFFTLSFFSFSYFSF